MLQRIGRYEILDRIAAGGQGTVYRARDTVLDRVVAVKVINQPVTDDPEYLEALQREARLAAGLSCFTGHNPRDTFATLVTEESGDLTLAMQLIRDKVPGVALRYVQRDLPALLERYSPVRQLKRKPSPLVGESLVETGESRTTPATRIGGVGGN